MPMTDEKITSVCEEMAARLKSEIVNCGEPPLQPKRHDDPSESWESLFEHLLFMCEEIPRLLPRREKAMRWLGWAQGVMLGLGELKRLNMPEAEIVQSND
ncbi:MAG: hypothetical protein E6R03_14780 [Hyphomicrobiaceae bacterium]|nr:MAG: hypothetical protein E6R03_14780 [Hyphomicrobiaceae bacterium]